MYSPPLERRGIHGGWVLNKIPFNRSWFFSFKVYYYLTGIKLFLSTIYFSELLFIKL